MKRKATKNTIKALSNHVIKLGYCEAWYLLMGIEPSYYGSGVYGWNWDCYMFDNGLAICTGYRDIPGIRSGVSIQEYENQAAAIAHDYTLTSDQQLEKIAEIRNRFLTAAAWFTLWEKPYINTIKTLENH